MFYDKFKMLCEQKGVSCNKAVLAIGLSNALPTKWKKTSAVPKGEVLLRIANYFDVTVDFLLDDDIQEKDPSPKGQVSEDDIKFALFGGANVTDEQFEEVKRFAQFIANKHDHD